MQFYIYQVRGTFNIPADGFTKSCVQQMSVLREFQEKGFPVVVQGHKLTGVYDGVVDQLREKCPSLFDIKGDDTPSFINLTVDKVELLGTQVLGGLKLIHKHVQTQKAFPGKEVSR